MDDAMRDRVWERWVQEHPYDADVDDATRTALLDTYTAEVMAFRLACEDLAEPARSAAIRLADDLDVRFARLRDEGLRAALRAAR